MTTHWMSVESKVAFRKPVTPDEDGRDRGADTPDTAVEKQAVPEKSAWRRYREGAAAAWSAAWACIFSLRCWRRVWGSLLDLAYVAWVVRVPLVALTVGLLLMSTAPQAQDLLVDLAPDRWWRVLGFLMLVLFWVAITTYASFLLLGTDRRLLDHTLARKYSDGPAYRRLEWFRDRMPYALGALPFFIIGVAAWRSYWNLPVVDDLYMATVKWSLWKFMGYVVALGVAFLCLSWWRPKGVCALINRAEMSARRLNDRMPNLLTFGVNAAGPNAATLTKHYVGPLLLFIVFACSAFIFFRGPNIAGAWLPRALIVPVVLGGWLPLLTLLSSLGRRWRAPLISGGFLAIAVISWVVGDNHSVRRIVVKSAANSLTLAAAPAASSDMNLRDAVALWMEENGCADAPVACPRPIIIAGAGGASRAGFFTASVIGNLMDDAHYKVATAIPEMNATTVRKRIFAISSVSGGSVGAVMTVAAMARGGPTTRQPCKEAKPELWYGYEINNWRDCLEALTAGDFLTPVVLGLIFNDRISFGWWQDRAAVLEQSWEERFAAITGAAAADNDWQDCPGDLRCPFMSLQPKRGQWLPLLVLNGTSATTGRRIITSILQSDYDVDDCPTRAPSQSASVSRQVILNRSEILPAPPATLARPQPHAETPASREPCLLFPESYSFHELLDNNRRDDGWWTSVMVWLQRFRGEPMKDVRLSTAAHNSARFPIISPPGAVRNLQHQVIDRIVDGGYVDNYGALTALDLAQAIHAIQPKLAPFVLAISNDPDEDPDLNPLDTADGTFLGDLTIPVAAVMSARVGHGRLAMAQAEAVLDHMAKPVCGAQTAHVRVWPQFENMVIGQVELASKDKTSRPVSMSWWLSTPIQLHLHQQTENRPGMDKNRKDMESTWAALDKPAGCVGREVAPSAAEAQQRTKAK